MIALAERRSADPAAVLADGGSAPVVVLEDPRDLGNLGACVRVAAAATPPACSAPAATIHGIRTRFAAPPACTTRCPSRGSSRCASSPADRPLLAIDPAGEPLLEPGELPARAVLAFGTERHGLSDELLAEADARVSIPMRPGVSSLNLATSVSAVLFAWRLSARAIQPLS